jgi:ComF family protein
VRPSSDQPAVEQPNFDQPTNADAPGVTLRAGSAADTAPAQGSVARPRLRAGLRQAGALLRHVFAPHCVLCDTARGDPLCTGCAADYFAADVHRCRACALRLGPATGDLCGRCLRDPPAFDATVTLADYAAPVDGLIVALKFGHRLEIARALGHMLGQRLVATAPADALVVAVPLAFERQRERGFNQALEIARVAARFAGLSLLVDALVRIRHRVPQESLALDARRRNVRGAFSVPARMEPKVAGRSIVVVDDVMTSGSTLDEAARLLKRAGARQVFNATVARTP